MIAHAGSHDRRNVSSACPREVTAASPARQRQAARVANVGACGPPWRDPAHMSPKERLRELAALWAAAYRRWKGLDAVSDGEPSCAPRPRAAGAARARRGPTQR